MILTWIILSFVVAFIGIDRKIGYFGTLILSLLLSPLIGVIFALASQRKNTMPTQKISKEAITYYDLAIREKRKGNFEKAVELLHNAQNYSPNSKLILIALSVCYSGLKNKERAFFFLENAIENGFDNFKYIQQTKDFEYLRKQTEFQEFAESGYKFVKKQTTFEPNEDSISKLEKLSQLKEKGILTDDEFQKEKDKILT